MRSSSMRCMRQVSPARIMPYLPGGEIHSLRAGQLLTGDFWTLRAVVVSRRNKDRPNIRRSRFLFALQPLRFIGREISVLQPEGHSWERFSGEYCGRSLSGQTATIPLAPSTITSLQSSAVAPIIFALGKCIARKRQVCAPVIVLPQSRPARASNTRQFPGGEFLLRPGQAGPVERDAASERATASRNC